MEVLGEDAGEGGVVVEGGGGVAVGSGTGDFYVVVLFEVYAGGALGSEEFSLTGLLG